MKTITFLFLLVLSQKCFSQKVNGYGFNQTAYYDSSQFIVFDYKTKLRELAGQEVLVLPKSHKYANNDECSFLGYGNVHCIACSMSDENFYASPTILFLIYDKIKRECGNEKRSDNSVPEYVSDYNSIAGKKFKISRYVGNGSYELINEDNSDLVYYFGECTESPLLVVGYLEKLKIIYLNKVFIYNQSHTLIDNVNGKTVDNVINSEWKCSDITLADYTDNQYQEITFILNNNSGNQIAVELPKFKRNFIDKIQHLQELENERIKEEKIKAQQEEIAKEQAEQEKKERIKEEARIAEQVKIADEKTDEEKRKKIAALKEAEKVKNEKIAKEEIKQKRKDDFIKKYGSKYGALIADGQVKIGMTKEMCIAAWGNPNEKNKQNTVLEKWIYNSKSIYFDKTGIVTAIQ